MIAKTSKTRGRKAHDHMVYMGPNGIGITSPGEDGHAHVVRETGVTESGEPIIELEEANGHSHSLVPIPAVARKHNAMKNVDRAAKVLSLYSDRKNVLRGFHKRMHRDRQIYLSNQWPEGVEASLKKRNRAAHNINEIKPKVDLISGFLGENKTKTVHSPVESDDGTIAEVLNRTSYHIDNKGNYETEIEMVREDQLQKGMGAILIRIDTKNDLRGQIVKEKFNPEDVLFGPHEKLDAEDCEFAILRKWISKEEAKALWPRISDDIDVAFDAAKMGISADAGPDDDYDQEFVQTAENLSADLFDISRKNVRVLELLQVVPRRVPVIFNVQHNFYFNAENLLQEDLHRLLDIPLLSVQHKVFKSVESTKVVGSVFAEHGKLVFSSLPVRPVYCVKDHEEGYGLIHFVTDLQSMANKSRSLYSDIINRAAEYIWLTEENSMTKQQKAKFMQGKVEPGSLVTVDNVDKLRKIEGTKVPAEVLALEQRYGGLMFDHMGGNSVILGQANTQGSALLFREFKRQALLGLSYLKRNMDITKKAIARLQLEAIEALYTPDRIASIVNLQTNFHIKPEDVFAAMQGMSILDSDIEIVEDTSAATFKDEQFAIWAELLSVPDIARAIPPQISMAFLLDMANPPGKDKFLAALSQQASLERSDKLTTDQSQLLASQPDQIKVNEYLKNGGQIPGFPDVNIQQ